MKSVQPILNFLVFGILLLSISSSCGSHNRKSKKTPAAVSELFFRLLKDQEFEKAKELGTDRTDRVVNTIEMLSQMAGGINLLNDNKKELIGCTERGDTCICTYKAFSGPDEQVLLLREKGKWYIELLNKGP